MSIITIQADVDVNIESVIDAMTVEQLTHALYMMQGDEDFYKIRKWCRQYLDQPHEEETLEDAMKNEYLVKLAQKYSLAELEAIHGIL